MYMGGPLQLVRELRPPWSSQQSLPGDLQGRFPVGRPSPWCLCQEYLIWKSFLQTLHILFEIAFSDVECYKAHINKWDFLFKTYQELCMPFTSVLFFISSFYFPSDPFLKSTSLSLLIPTSKHLLIFFRLNIYHIVFPYIGVGTIYFFVHNVAYTVKLF